MRDEETGEPAAETPCAGGSRCTGCGVCDRRLPRHGYRRLRRRSSPKPVPRHFAVDGSEPGPTTIAEAGAADVEYSGVVALAAAICDWLGDGQRIDRNPRGNRRIHRFILWVQ